MYLFGYCVPCLCVIQWPPSRSPALLPDAPYNMLVSPDEVIQDWSRNVRYWCQRLLCVYGVSQEVTRTLPWQPQEGAKPLNAGAILIPIPLKWPQFTNLPVQTDQYERTAQFLSLVYTLLNSTSCLLTTLALNSHHWSIWIHWIKCKDISCEWQKFSLRWLTTAHSL